MSGLVLAGKGASRPGLGGTPRSEVCHFSVDTNLSLTLSGGTLTY